MCGEVGTYRLVILRLGGASAGHWGWSGLGHLGLPRVVGLPGMGFCLLGSRGLCRGRGWGWGWGSSSLLAEGPTEAFAKLLHGGLTDDKQSMYPQEVLRTQQTEVKRRRGQVQQVS